MSLKRRSLNILLIILCLILGGWAACIYKRPPLILDNEPPSENDNGISTRDTIYISGEKPRVSADSSAATPIDDSVRMSLPVTSERERIVRRVETVGFKDAEPRMMSAGHPFRQEALKILSGRLEETDSASRHKILSYCEHLRASYETRDIDFIRQVFSDDALIIVGHVVRSKEGYNTALTDNSKVRYSIRSKKEYLEKLSHIFNSGKDIDVRFSEFRIMRHATAEGIYGVTLRQNYSCGAYSDDGYMFLLWDFRDSSMPLIHVRTWQPSSSIVAGDDDIIDMGDFNLE